MNNMTFLIPSFVLLITVCASLLSLLIPKHGKVASHWLNVIGTAVFAITVYGQSTYSLTDFFHLGQYEVDLVLILSLFNILIILFNGHQKLSNARNSVLATFVFIGSVFLIGATEFVSFYLAMELMSLITYVLVALSGEKYSNEAAVKYFIQGSVISAVFLLGVAFFFGATGSFNFTEYDISNQPLYVISVVLFLATTCFKLGAFPFHTWMADVYSNVKDGNLAANFLMSKVSFGYVFLILMQKLVTESAPIYQGTLISLVLTVAIVSALYGNLLGIVQGQFKRIIAYSSLAHTGYLLMAISLDPDQGYQSQIIFYLMFYSISACGAISLINYYVGNDENGDHEKSLWGGFYRDGFRGIALSVFVLSLAGIPLTAGFTTKFLLFTNYFRDGLLIVPIFILGSSVIGLAYYIKFLVSLFMENPIKKGAGEQVLVMRVTPSIIIFGFLLLTIAGGVMPSLFFK